MKSRSDLKRKVQVDFNSVTVVHDWSTEPGQRHLLWTVSEQPIARDVMVNIMLWDYFNGDIVPAVCVLSVMN